MVYHKSDYLRIAILAIVYALLAKLVLAFFAANGVISLIWPLSGLAITCLLVGGNKYWPGIFIGALAGNYMSGNPVDVSFAIATGNTLEALLCTFLLTRANHFNDKFEHIIDFFMLGFAASVSACVAALIGVSALVLKGISTQQELFANLIYWWQGDVLGILLLSPLLLVWRQLPRGWFKRERVLETIACFGLAFLAGQIVFLGWFHDFFGITARGFWVFIFVVWSAVRFGRHGVLLTLALTALQMLIGTVLQAEGFAQNLVPTGMLNFWFYMIALTLTGVSLALVIEGRERAEAAIKQTDIIFNKLSQQVPGVIYQFRLYPDGRSCFPFASEAIQDIYEVTPEQVREDASAVFAILHPEDYDSVVASIQHSAQTLTRWRHEYRVVLPRQGVCWRLGESDPEKLEDGSVVWYGFISDISERKKAEGDIYQSESILSATINSSLDAVVHMDAEGVITRWSAQAEKTFGWTRAEAIGQKLEETIIPQRYREAHVRGMKHFLASGEGPVLNSRIELSALHRDGHELPVELSITPLKIADKYHFSAFIRDITRRRRSDERIERLKHLYQALSEVNQAIVRMENQDELFPLVCRCAVEFGGMKMAWIGQLDEASSLVAPVASYGSGLEYLDGIVVSSSAEVPEGRGPIGTAMRENKPIVVNDYFASPLTLPWQKKADIYGWNSAAAFPILRGGQQFGVLSVYHSQTNAFDAETIALLTEMSTDIAFALDNFDRKVQRKYDEESLQLAASIYETSSEAMMVMDAESRVLAINPAFTTITGYLEEEALGQSLDTFKSNHHDEAFYQAIRDEINNTGKWQGEIWARRKNGEVYPTLVVINTIYNKDGSVLRRVWLFNDISKRKETEEFIWRQANYDLLTGLPNRRMFQDRVEQEFKKVHRANLPLVLLFLDLDYFKEVNDTLGHATGDMLLKEAAQRIAGCVRESDTVARFGGDEFTILLSDLDDNDTVNRVIQSILQALSKPFKLNDETVYLTASIGVTCYPDDGLEIETLIKNADQAMYAAKAAGRNGYSYFTPTMQAVAQARMKLANDLRSAMQENQFWVAYQPILDLKSGKIIKAEALVRWQHPKLGLVSPAEFIPVAEHTGLINDIGEFVFLQATQQVRRWQKLYDNEFQVSVNVSPVQFNDKSGKYKAWRQQLTSLGLSGKSIVVEITEGLLLEASDLIKEKLIEYRDAGIQVALDDFGTGYSSLSYLKKFDIDYIKIDQSFVRNLSSSSGELALCEAMVVMAHKLGMAVIAEGVETEVQRDLLIEIGCDYAQGYLFSRPLPMSEFEKLLLNT